MLHCTPKTRGFYVSMAPKVIDGTMCDKDPYKICVNGKVGVMTEFEIDYKQITSLTKPP